MIASVNSAKSKVLSLKCEGNEAFIKGSKSSNNTEGFDYLKRACVLYGEAINLILLLESNLNIDDVETTLHDAFVIIRPTLFLNLAASNLKLNAADGALQCCNSAMQLCNAPGLLYSDLASSKDIVDIVHPVAEVMLLTMTKALFRRGTCFETLGDVDCALKDYRAAVSISPGNQELKLLLMAAEERMRCSTDLEKNKSIDQIAESVRSANKRADRIVSKESMSMNGGRCWMRKGYWSQTVTDVIVYLPLHVVHLEFYAEKGEISADSAYNLELMRNNFKVDFRNHSITMSISSERKRILSIDLEHAVISSECTWTLDLDSDPQHDGISNLDLDYLVIHLSKAPKFEWFPGQEWWDRVCQGDESIDTTCCTLGADVSQLPREAKLKAQKESCRFQDLSEKQRVDEIQLLVKAKQDMSISQVRTSAAVLLEDDALDLVPERAGMLESMRKEFPHIDITTK